MILIGQKISIYDFDWTNIFKICQRWRWWGSFPRSTVTNCMEHSPTPTYGNKNGADTRMHKPPRHSPAGLSFKPLSEAVRIARRNSHRNSVERLKTGNASTRSPRISEHFVSGNLLSPRIMSEKIQEASRKAAERRKSEMISPRSSLGRRKSMLEMISPRNSLGRRKSMSEMIWRRNSLGRRKSMSEMISQRNSVGGNKSMSEIFSPRTPRVFVGTKNNEEASLATPFRESNEKLWIAMYENPNNLRVVIDREEHPLRPHQNDALLQLRAGKKTKSMSLDSHGTVWYHPVRTAVMKEAGIKPPLCEIVLKDTILPMPACAATSYFLQVCLYRIYTLQSYMSRRIHDINNIF